MCEMFDNFMEKGWVGRVAWQIAKGVWELMYHCRPYPVEFHGMVHHFLTFLHHTHTVSSIQSIISAKTLLRNIWNNSINCWRETASPLRKLDKAGGATKQCWLGKIKKINEGKIVSECSVLHQSRGIKSADDFRLLIPPSLEVRWNVFWHSLLFFRFVSWVLFFSVLLRA